MSPAVAHPRFLQPAYEALLAALDQPILVADDAEHCVYANEPACALLGVGPDELWRARLDRFVLARRRSPVAAVAGYRPASSPETELDLRRKDGSSVTARVREVVVPGAGGSLRVLVMRDSWAQWADLAAGERRAERIGLLYEVALNLAREHNPQALLRLIVARACSMLGAERSVAWLWNEQRGVLMAVAHVGFPGGLPSNILKPDEGATGRAFAGAEPVLVEDYQEWEGADLAFRGIGTRSLLAVPLRVGGRRLGALDVAAAEPNRFGREEAELLMLMGLEAATALLHFRGLASEAHRPPASGGSGHM